jgi:hypothetical protein
MQRDTLQIAFWGFEKWGFPRGNFCGKGGRFFFHLFEVNTFKT